MFAEAIETLLIQHCPPSVVRAIESGASPQPLAKAFEDSGFYELLAPEDIGGGGASWRELFEIVLLCGAHAVPLPIAQTLAARSIVAQPQTLPFGLLTFAPLAYRRDDGSIEMPYVPFGKTASHVLAAQGDTLGVFSTVDASEVVTEIHGGLAATLRWQQGAGRPITQSVSTDRFFALAALLHAALLAGAMKRSFDLTMAYANERTQFGKPIGKFQAIQHQLSVMAEHVAAGRIAAEAAFAVSDGLPALAACAVAKARTSEAAQLVASIAHAVHGAIGITEEYDLQLFTRRLHEWRMAHGSEAYWHRRLGQLFAESAEPLATDFVRSIFDIPRASVQRSSAEGRA